MKPCDQVGKTSTFLYFKSCQTDNQLFFSMHNCASLCSSVLFGVSIPIKRYLDLATLIKEHLTGDGLQFRRLGHFQRGRKHGGM